jgi:hypothetical protein
MLSLLQYVMHALRILRMRYALRLLKEDNNIIYLFQSMGKTMHYCSYCDYQSDRRWDVSRHEAKKHQNQNIQNNKLQQPLEPQLITSYMQGYPQLQPVHHGQVFHQQPVHHGQVTHQQPIHHGQLPHQQPVHHGLSQDSMDTDSVDLDTESVPTDGEDEDEENVDNLNDLINKIHYTFLDLKELRDDYRRALEQVKNLDTEQLRDVLENYADLEIEILDEQDGVDPEENGDGDESEEEEGVDKNGGDEETDTCTRCEKGCILDFVFELRDVIEDDEKKTLENIIGKKKNEFLELKENENKDDTDDEEVELSTKSDIIQKDVRNVEEVCDKFKEEGGEYFKDCSKSKLQSVCEMCKVMDDNVAFNTLKRKYPNKYAHLNETIHKLRKDSVSKLSDSQVTIHNKRKTLQKSQVGEGILTILKNLVLPDLKSLTNIK